MDLASTLSDNQFIKMLENKSLHKSYFDHIGHLRLAWIYLNKYSLECSLGLISSNIKLYAENLGATDKFNQTITTAIVLLVAKRINELAIKTWDEFIELNQDIVNDCLAVIKQFYSHELLFSEKAKREFVFPDKCMNFSREL